MTSNRDYKVIHSRPDQKRPLECQDGETRACRIRGKMKKRDWVREGDIVLVSPWDFQSDEKGDIIFRYTQNQAIWLQRRGILKID